MNLKINSSVPRTTNNSFTNERLIALQFVTKYAKVQQRCMILFKINKIIVFSVKYKITYLLSLLILSSL